ncbi:MAG: lyase family protein, partial [Cetobacterium sp.]|nr:lyase family protein [Cetobacterium sp.]
MGKKYRIERDSLGEIKILEENLWGVTTERALKFFNISKEKFPKEMIRAYGIIKKSCALANFKLNMLGNYEKELIVKICNEIIKGKFDKEFPLNIWISGSGTQFNMNFNEVISNYASVLEGYPKGSKIPLHPNDHVNCSQSTNDTFPSAMSIAFYIKAKEELLPELLELQLILEKKAVEFFPIKKIGRTHMQDAVPMQLGEEFLNYSILIKENIFRIEKALEELLYLPIGGTAIG